MQQYICPECGSELKENGNFYECIDIENCGYRITINKFQSQTKHWLQKIYEDNSLWNKELFEVDIPIISHEYKRLYEELCKNRQSYGMLLEIKDIFEIIIKFPTLLAVSIIYDKNQKDDHENKLLMAMIEKNLSLGDWVNIANMVKRFERIDKNLLLWLKEVCIIFNKKDIVSWRNSEIGHGALSLEENEGFQKDIKEKLNILKSFFDKHIEILKLLHDKKYQNIMNKSIFFKKDANGYIYFFDSFSIYSKKTTRLEYQQGISNKTIEDSFLQLSNSFNIKKNENLLDDCADDSIREAKAQEMFEKLQTRNDFIEPKYLTSWLNDNLKKHTQGLFLLQMQRGMGKTMFSRALDELSLHLSLLQEAPLVRAYYINDVYGYKRENFTNDVDRYILNKYLENNEIKDKFRGDLPEPLNSTSTSKDLVRLLNQYKTIYNKDKLLFVIDGLDEMPNNDEKNLLDLIPNSDELQDGIYILLTSRVKLSGHVDTKLESLSFTDTKKVLLDEKEYEENIHNFIKNKIFTNQNITQDIIETVYDRSEKRFVYLSLIKELVKNMGLDIKNIPQVDKIIQLYLDNLKQKYGDKFFTNITKLLAVVATQFEAMTIKEIAYMMGEECINFKLLAWINDTKSFLKFERSYRGNLISIAHDDMKEYLKNDKNVLNHIEKIVGEKIDLINHDKYKLQSNNHGEKYFLNNILGYIQYYNPKLIKAILKEKFIEKYFLYAVDYKKESIYDDYIIGNIYQTIINLYDIANKQNIELNEFRLACSLSNMAVEYLYNSKKKKQYAKTAIIFFDKLKQENKLKDNRYMIQAYMALAIVQEDPKEAKIYLYEANKLVDENTDKQVVANIYANLAHFISIIEQDFTKAINYTLEAIRICEHTNCDILTLSNSYNNLAIYYSNNNQFKKARQSIIKAICLNRKHNKKKNLSLNYRVFADIFKKYGHNKNAELFYNKAISVHNRLIASHKILINDAYIELFIALGNFLFENKSYKKALENYQKVMVKFHNFSNFLDINNLYLLHMNCGACYSALGKQKKAIKEYKEALDIVYDMDKDKTYIKQFSNACMLVEKLSSAQIEMKKADEAIAILDEFIFKFNDRIDIEYFDIFLEIISKIEKQLNKKYTLLRADIFLYKSRKYALLNDNSNAILSINECIENLKQLPHIERLYNAYLDRSRYYLSVFDYENSLKDSQEGLNILQKIKNHKEDYDKNAELGLLVNTGMAYFQKQELDVALSYLDKAIVLYEKEDKAILDSDFTIKAFLRRATISLIYENLSHLDKVKKDIQEATKIYEMLSNKEANIFLELYNLKIQIEAVQKNMQEVISIYEKVELELAEFEQFSKHYNEELLLSIFVITHNTYLELRNFKKARLVANKFLSLLINILESNQDNQKSFVFYNAYGGVVEELFGEKMIDDENIARYKTVEFKIFKTHIQK